MEWIETNRFVKLLQRFRERRITAYRIEDGRKRRHVWWCHGEMFSHEVEGLTEVLSVETMLTRYSKIMWRPERFFHLGSEKEKELAVRIVEHLIETGNMEWIIGDTDIEFARQCAHCGHLFDEGWMVGTMGCYCSTECLLADHPGLTKDRLQEMEEDEEEDVFRTEWRE